MVLELCLSLTWRLSGLSRLLGGPVTWRRLSLSSLHAAGGPDAADAALDEPARTRLRGVSYVERVASRRGSVCRFLATELGVPEGELRRAPVRLGRLADAGLPTITENLLFLTDRGVSKENLRKDVDILGVIHDDLLLAHALVERLPGADYRSYYPLSRTERESMREVFRRLPHHQSNLVHALSQILRLPELTVCRATSRMSAQVKLFKNKKILKNAQLFMELRVPPTELAASLYVLRLPGALIRRREQQCRQHGLQFHPTHVSISEADFQRRLMQGSRLAAQTGGVEALLARRLGAAESEVRERLRHGPLRVSLTTGRLQETARLLEAAGYGRDALLAALPHVFLRPPQRVGERLRRYMEASGGRLPPVTTLVVSRHRFEGILRRQRAATPPQGENRTGRGGDKTDREDGKIASDREDGEIFSGDADSADRTESVSPGARMN